MQFNSIFKNKNAATELKKHFSIFLKNKFINNNILNQTKIDSKKFIKTTKNTRIQNILDIKLKKDNYNMFEFNINSNQVYLKKYIFII